MALTGAFQPQGLTVSLTSNAAGGTSNSALITNSIIGALYKPMSVRFCPQVGNTDMIWYTLTAALTACVIPTPGTASPSAGTPTGARPLFPGVIEVLGQIPWNANVNGTANSGFYINFLSATASQTFHMIFGEGV